MSVLIDVDYNGTLDICNSSGKLIKALPHKSKSDDCTFITIIGKNDSTYHVIVSHSIDKETINGWIRRDNSHISIYSKTCMTNPVLNLYEKPDKKSKMIHTIKEHTDYLRVKDCENNWLFISAIISGKKYEGWISPDMQCSNPYTTCCGT